MAKLSTTSATPKFDNPDIKTSIEVFFALANCPRVVYKHIYVLC